MNGELDSFVGKPLGSEDRSTGPDVGCALGALLGKKLPFLVAVVGNKDGVQLGASVGTIAGKMMLVFAGGVATTVKTTEAISRMIPWPLRAEYRIAVTVCVPTPGVQEK